MTTDQNTNMLVGQACESALSELRGALVDLYNDIGLDPEKPQDVSRELSLGKTLTWNLARLIRSDDSLATITHVPGRASFEKLIDATRQRGASDNLLIRVHKASIAFDEMTALHVGDRATLDLVADLSSSQGEPGLRQSRKSAFYGNSGLYGVQAHTQYVGCFVSPNADAPSTIDIAMVRGLLGIRRLREHAELPISQIRHWSDGNQALGTHSWQPIDPDRPDFIITDFSSGDLSAIEPRHSSSEIEYVLQPGPVGNAGLVNLFVGDMMRHAAARFATPEDQTGLFGSAISIPCERLVFDLIVNAELEFMLHDTAQVLVTSPGLRRRDSGSANSFELPLSLQSQRLAGSPPSVAIPSVPRCRELGDYVFARLECDPKCFVGSRLQLNFPPIGSTIVRRFHLPEARKEGG